MAAFVETFWNDLPLRRAVRSAMVPAARAWAGAAAARAAQSSKAVAGSIRVRTDLTRGVSLVRAGHPLAHIIEGGSKAHDIPPGGLLTSRTSRSRRRSSSSGLFETVSRTSVRRRSGGKQALKFPDGGFSRGTVHHPGTRPRPFFGPTLVLWPSFYRASVARVLAVQGSRSMGLRI